SSAVSLQDSVVLVPEEESFLDPEHCVDAALAVPASEVDDDASMDDDDASMDEDEEGEDAGFPEAPPGCRWVIETPEGEFLDLPSASASSPFLLDEAARRLQAVCEGAEDAIVSGSVSPLRLGADRLVALGSCDDKCRLYLVPSLSRSLSGGASASPALLAPVAVLDEGKDTVSATAFSLDGRLLACGCFDGDVRIYSIPSSSSSSSPSSSPSSSASSSSSSPSSSPSSPPSSSSGSSASSSGSSSSSALEASMLHHLKGPTADVTALAFHPRGYAVLAVSADQTAWVWLLPTSTEKRGSRAPAPVTLSVFVAGAPLTACAFGAEGKTCIVGAADGSVNVFEAKTGRALSAFLHPAFEPLAKAPGVCVRRPQTVGFGAGRQAGRGKEEEEADNATPRGVVTLRVFARPTAGRSAEKAQGDGGFGSGLEGLVCVGFEDGWIFLFNEKTGKAVFVSAAHTSSVEAVEFLPPGAETQETDPEESLAVAFFATRLERGLDGEKPETNAREAILTAAAVRAAWQGQLAQGCLLTAGLDGDLLVWNIAQRNVRAALSLSALSVASFASRSSSSVSPPLSKPAQTYEHDASEDPGRQERTDDQLFGKDEGVTRLCLHPGGLPIVAAGTTNGNVLLVDLRQGEAVGVWAAHETGAVMELLALEPHAAKGESEDACRGAEGLRLWPILSAGEDGLGKLWAVDVLEGARPGASRDAA
ncbi:WD domain, G-beta repeat-containing protein, partial [Toxoplasma gondii MAS]